MLEYTEEYSRDNTSQRYKDLLKEYEKLHALDEGMFNGRSLVRFAGPLEQIINKHDCATLLDYGWITWRETWTDCPYPTYKAIKKAFQHNGNATIFGEMM